MIKSAINKILGHLGYRIVRLQKNDVVESSSVTQRVTVQADYSDQLAREPLNPDLHFKFGLQCFEQHKYSLAFAELKTASFVGKGNVDVEAYVNRVLPLLPKVDEMDHNKFFRLQTLASAILQTSNGNEISILDVGGGQGELAQFFPQMSYCLAEPTVNGISGINLPFPERSFDVVTACHVLEHVAIRDREQFLDQLLSKAKKALLLLNPFFIEGTSVEERLKLFIDVTDAGWAKEHLKYTLPSLGFIEDYAKKRKLKITVQPNGTLTTSIAMVFVNYFGQKTGDIQALTKINSFLNTKYGEILNSKESPNAYLICFEVPGQ